MLKFPWIAIYATNAKSIQFYSILFTSHTSWQSSIIFSCTSRQIYRLDSKKRCSVEGIRVSNLIDGDLSVEIWRFDELLGPLGWVVGTSRWPKKYKKHVPKQVLVGTVPKSKHHLARLAMAIRSRGCWELQDFFHLTPLKTNNRSLVHICSTSTCVYYGR